MKTPEEIAVSLYSDITDDDCNLRHAKRLQLIKLRAEAGR